VIIDEVFPKKRRPRLGDVQPQTLNDWKNAYLRATRERDEARAEVERLKAELAFLKGDDDGA